MKRTVLFKILACSAGMLILSAHPVFGEDGWQQDSGQNWIYRENDKKAVNQWARWPDGTMRFLGPDGLITVNGWVNHEGARYRVKEDGSRYENEWFSIVLPPSLPSGKPYELWYYAGSEGKLMMNGWHEIEGRQYYFYPSGNSPRKTYFTVDDRQYYVDENGARPLPGWYFIEGVDVAGNAYRNWYYTQPDGSLLTDGWYDIDGITYYFNKNGNSPRASWLNLDDKRCYIDEDGVLKKGWFSISGVSAGGQEYTSWYYADSTGNLWRGGWGNIEGKWYYFDPYGLSYRKRWYVDQVKNERYYFGENGVLEDHGWFKIEYAGSASGSVSEYWYYAQDTGAVLKEGYRKIGGKTYYFDAGGINYRKRWMTDESGGRRYLGADGAMCSKEWFVISGLDSRDSEYNYWYYAGEDGRIVLDKWQKIGGKTYCFNSAGMMCTGWLTETPDDDDKESSYYYCGGDGARVSGWQWLEIPNSWMDSTDVADYVQEHGQFAYFYFNQSSGKKKRSADGKREMKVDGATYCFDSYGIMYPGWVKMSGATPEIKGYRYFYQPQSETDQRFIQGQKVESTWLKLEGPADASGSGQKEWYYFDNTGKPACGKEDGYAVEKIRDAYYVFDMFGAAQYGLVEVNGDFYYCGTEGGDRRCATGKVMVEDGVDAGRSQYYFDLKGKGVTGVKDGCAYYKGKLQKADRASRYEVFDIPGEGKRLLSTSGRVMKNTSVTDGNDQKWQVGSGGKIIVYGSDETAEILEPEATVTY